MDESMTAVEIMGLRVPPSPFLTETRARRIAEGRYEQEEIAGALAVVGPEDRVLEMGAGLGIVGGVIARTARPQALLSFEANPGLIPHIKVLQAENGLCGVAEVRNEVLLAGPEMPQSVSFFLRNSFLGSSLIEPEAKAQEVQIPTARFDAVRDSFRPTVLVIDIEGGELDFLAHAELTGIRAVVIEFHPNVYGTEGVKACKDALRRQGFRQVEAVSTRFVWTCVREVAPEVLVVPPPSPTQGWSHSLRVIPNALVKAPTERGLSVPSGVMTEDGRDVPEAPLWRNRRRLNLPFARPEAAEELSGTWYWGGVLWTNFAHFVVETPCRLWGLDHLKVKPDGLLFIPRREFPVETLEPVQRAFLDALGIDLPVRIVHPAAKVERLVVAGQGFGLGEISSGTAPFRAYMAAHFGKEIAPEGPEKLYVSRSMLGASKGALLGEKQIEAALAAQGYETFHPQQHDLATQIARYKAAKVVLASEGSALHVLAYVGRPGQKVGVIARRRSGATDHILAHLRNFIGTEPVLFDPLRRVWVHLQSKRGRLSVGEPDLVRLQEALVQEGFLEPAAPWEPLDEAMVQAQLGEQYAPREV